MNTRSNYVIETGYITIYIFSPAYCMFTVWSAGSTYLKMLSWQLRTGEPELLEKYVRGGWCVGWYRRPGVVQAFCAGTLQVTSYNHYLSFYS